MEIIFLAGAVLIGYSGYRIIKKARKNNIFFSNAKGSYYLIATVVLYFGGVLAATLASIFRQNLLIVLANILFYAGPAFGYCWGMSYINRPIKPVVTIIAIAVFSTLLQIGCFFLSGDDFWRILIVNETRLRESFWLWLSLVIQIGFHTVLNYIVTKSYWDNMSSLAVEHRQALLKYKYRYSSFFWYTAISAGVNIFGLAALLVLWFTHSTETFSILIAFRDFIIFLNVVMFLILVYLDHRIFTLYKKLYRERSKHRIKMLQPFYEMLGELKIERATFQYNPYDDGLGLDPEELLTDVLREIEETRRLVGIHCSDPVTEARNWQMIFEANNAGYFSAKTKAKISSWSGTEPELDTDKDKVATVQYHSSDYYLKVLKVLKKLSESTQVSTAQPQHSQH